MNGLDINEIPMVIQFNKRDLPDVRSDEEIAGVGRKGKEPVVKAIAIKGEGVMETLEGILRLTWRSLNNKYDLEEKLQVKENEFIAGVLKRSARAGRPTIRKEEGDLR
jgi:signal recognition particle receptor subunit beta